MKTFVDDTNVDPLFVAMLKRFNNQIKKDGILDEVRLRRYFQKPSEKKRLEEKERRRNAQRQILLPRL